MGQPGSPKVVDTVVPVDSNANDLDNVVVGSTAQPGLVYQPGATYPNASKWSGNRCNDLAALVTKSLAMHGERVVAIDLQFVGGAKTLNTGAALDFGGDVTFVGVRNPTTGQIPSLTFDLNTRIVASGRIEVRDLAIAVASSNTGPVITLDATHKVDVVASGNTTIVAKGASREWVRATVTGLTVTLEDLAVLPAGQGDSGGTFAAIKATTGSIDVQCFGAAAVQQAAVDAASCFLDVRAPGVFVDPSFGARINLFPGVLYVASGTPGSVGVVATAPGCVYLDDSSGTSYYWTGSAWASMGGGGGSSVTGTGFWHNTSGSLDPAARAVNLASADVTGTLPSGNQAAQTLAGDATGTTSASIVGKVNGATVPAAGALTTGTVLRATGASALGYGAVDLANASAVTGVLPTGNQAAQTMGGQASGTTAAATITNATMPAGNAPQLGSGYDQVSPDGTSGTTRERSGNWTALSTDAATTIPVSPALSAIAASNVATVTVEIHITKDGDTTETGFGVWRRTIAVRNVAGTMKNTTGTSSDTPIVTSLGTGVAAATAVIDVSATTPAIKVTRPTGVACHARVIVVDVPSGWCGV